MDNKTKKTAAGYHPGEEKGRVHRTPYTVHRTPYTVHRTPLVKFWSEKWNLRPHAA